MARRKGGGSKLTRSRTVTVRLDPVTFYAAELAAAKERRTVSSFIEVACREATSTRQVAHDSEGRGFSALQIAERMWHANPDVQLVKLAWHAPHLLSTEQQLLGDAVRHFINELNLSVDTEKLRAYNEPPPDPEDFDSPCFPVHVAKAALREIKQAVAEKIDFARISELARRELAKRKIIRK